MEIKGIKKGDKQLRHFTFDDEDYVVRGGVYYYRVNYGKNQLEGDYAEDEIDYVPCDKVIPLGGKKPKPIPGRKKQEEPVAQVTQPTAPVVETPAKKRGRPAKVNKLESETVTIPVQTLAGTPVFEYYVAFLDAEDGGDLQDKLNTFGDEGWELCGFDTNRGLLSSTKIIAIFKREKKRVIK